MDEFFVCGGLLLLLLVGAAPIATLITITNFCRDQKQRESNLANQTRRLTEKLEVLQKLVASLSMAPPSPPPVQMESVPKVTAEIQTPVVDAAPIDDVEEVIDEPHWGDETAPIRPITPIGRPAAQRSPSTASATVFTPPKPREPNRFEVAAQEVLRKIWNWIIVGEDHVPKGVSIEYAFASQWLLRVGILMLVFAVGFFLKYSIDRDLIGPEARVGLAVVTGLGLLVGGTRILGGNYSIMGQGLMGGGITTLYFSVFAAANLFDPPLITALPAYAGMIIVTALSGGIAIRFHSKLVAVLGVLGGYGTPVMLSTGSSNIVGLYTYMTVLGLGVLWICSRKSWPLLNYLSWVCHWVLAIAALQKYVKSDFVSVMPFIVGFFVLFSTMVFIYNLRNRKPSNLLDVIVLFLNAGVFFGVSYGLVNDAFGHQWVAAVTLGLTVFYTVHVYYCLMRKILDRELMLTFTGLAAFFLAITVPLILSEAWITVSWSLQALVLMWIAGKLNSRFLRHTSYLLYAIVLFRFGLFDLGSTYASGSSAVDITFTDYTLQLVERVIMFGIPIASFAGAVKLLQKQNADSGIWKTENDIPELVTESRAVQGGIAVAVGMLFFFLHLELNRTFGDLLPAFRMPVLTLVWLGMCALLLREFRRTTSAVALGLLAIFSAGVLVKLVVFDAFAFWHLNENGLYGETYSVLDAGLRIADFGLVALFFLMGYRLLATATLTREPQVVMGVTGLILALIASTLELNTFLYHFLPGLQSGGISILWSLFALGMVLRGIRRNVKALRLAGLGLFTVVAGKVFFSDLAQLDQIYRVVALMPLAGLALSGSFLYLKYRTNFATPDEPSSEPLPNQSASDEATPHDL